MTEVQELVARVPVWVGSHDDVRAIALLGSWARKTARPDSDVDLLVLTNKPAEYVEETDWLTGLASGRLIRTAEWGPVTERRFRLRSGLELEVDIATAHWASVDPLDPGTVACVRGGFRVIYDPEGVLNRLLESV